MTYATVPELVTLNCIGGVADNEGVTILKFEGNVVFKDEYVSRPFETRTPVIVDADRLVP
jgi:hypothetical protein